MSLKWILARRGAHKNKKPHAVSLTSPERTSRMTHAARANNYSAKFQASDFISPISPRSPLLWGVPRSLSHTFACVGSKGWVRGGWLSIASTTTTVSTSSSPLLFVNSRDILLRSSPCFLPENLLLLFPCLGPLVFLAWFASFLRLTSFHLLRTLPTCCLCVKK